MAIDINKTDVLRMSKLKIQMCVCETERGGGRKNTFEMVIAEHRNEYSIKLCE